MTEQQIFDYRNRIIQQLYDEKIVVAIVNQHAYQWRIPKETEIIEDAIQEVYLTLMKMKPEKIIELYEYVHPNDRTSRLYKFKNYIGSICRTTFNLNPKYNSFTKKVFRGSMLKNGTDAFLLSNSLIDEPYTEDNLYTELWKDKVLSQLTVDENDFLQFWTLLSRVPKPAKIRRLYTRLAKKIECLCYDKPLPVSNSRAVYDYKLTDEEKADILNKKAVNKSVDYGSGKSLPILKCSVDGDVIKRYENVDEAANEMGVTTDCIFRQLRGREKANPEFLWKYEMAA